MNVMIKLALCCFSVFAVILTSCSGAGKSGTGDGKQRNASEDSVPKVKDSTFCFVCKGKGREENFDSCPIEVTTDNVVELYRKYEVKPIEGSDLYKVNPYKLYHTSRYFTRLIRFENGKQVGAVTFYGWNAPYVFPQDSGRYLVGLNSLATTAGYNESTFTCKSVLLDSSLNIINEREFRFPEQKDSYYAYAYFDTIVPRKDGYDFRVINTGFDPSDYYEYKGHLSKDNVVTASSRKNVDIDF